MKRTLRVAAFVLSLFATAKADLDLDSNGLGDVWEAKYRPVILLPGGDNDGDGRTNLQECEAGTDPLSADDIFLIGDIIPQDNDLRLTWKTQPGKRYQIQWTPTPKVDGSWNTIPGQLTGIDGELAITTPRPLTPTAFFRVIAGDVDTDNDGLTDWEELQVGFDPNADNQASCGCGEACGCGDDCACGGTDLERMTSMLQGTPTVSISATDADGTEPLVSPATDTATFRIKRRGGMGRLTVGITTSGTASASDHEALPPTVTIPMGAREAFVTIVPKPDSLAESPEVLTLTLAPGSGYSLGATTSADVLIHDKSAANGNGLRAEFWKHPGTTANSPYFEGAPVLTRIDATVNFNNNTAPWPGPPITVVAASNYFSSRWTGEVMPEFSQAYTFYTTNNEAGRLWVNGQLLINNWPPATVTTNKQSAIISLEAGKRYPIVFEHYNNTGGHISVLGWASQSQTEQVIPQARLFADTAPRILGPLELMTFVNGPSVNYQITASGKPLSYTATNLPPGLALNPVTGLISGSPTQAGDWKVTLTATNANGSGSAYLQVTVIETSGGIVRELWAGAAGSTIAQIPVTQAPTSTSVLPSLQAPVDAADSYGARIRGFITAPATGEYRFFLRADEAAVFYLSDDEEPVNAWKRAELTAPSSAADWAGAAQSPLLHLEAGRRYFLEILHKENSGGDHLALGWAKPGQPDNVPSEIVPGHVLTRFDAVALGSSPEGSLYFTALTPQAGAVTNAYGSATLRLSTDKKTAWVTPSFGNLGSAFFAMHVHDDRLPPTSNIVFDLDEPGVEILADGSHVWQITGVGSLTAEQIADGLAQHAYLNVHSVDYPNGEIKGYFRSLDGSASFTPPPAPPSWTAEAAAANSNAAAASRFLQQATFGANGAEIAALQSKPSYDAWIDEQFAKPVGRHLPYVEKYRNVTIPNNPTYSGNLTFNSWWKNSIESDDQLRQRVAFALSEIMVVSENGPLSDRGNALSSYYDTLLENSFGNARDLLEAVTLHPAMGRYLDMLRNDKPSITAGRIPNENYAREILQLFSLGLYRYHPDGSVMLNSKGLPIPVYDQDSIIGYAHVFTGWDYNYTGSYASSFAASSNWTLPMREVPARHFTGKKRLLNNVVLPGLPVLNGLPLDPYASHSGAAISGDPVFQALASQELDYVHDQLFNHPNIGPFLCRQLIQRLVTSTPSRGYVYRVVSKFNNNGAGVRGDMKAVIKAILLDYEARSLVAGNAPGFGKQREPIVRITQLARAFRPANNFGGTYIQDGGLISVNTNPAEHRMANSQKVLLGFDGGGGVASQDGDYTLITPVTPSEFTVRTRDVHRGTWAQVANVITVTTPVDHGFSVGQSVYLRFRNGHAGALQSGVFAVTAKPSNTRFEVAAPDAVPRTGECDAAWFRGGYTQTVTGGVATLTITSGTLTGLEDNARVMVNFTPGTGQTPPPNGIYLVKKAPGTEPRRFTLTLETGTPSVANNLSGTFHAAAFAPVLDRSGTAVSGYSDWNVGSTDTDLGQTPLNSPTVFNFFEPGYRHPGELATQGLETPEFQLSSDTNVIRQANFIFGGIYHTSSTSNLTSGYTNGFSSFRTGSHDIMMDFSPWMRTRTTGTDYWTNTTNLRDLIKELSKILMAGQMSQAMEDQIYNFVSLNANITYNATTPSEAERRNRIRAIIYFIAVSPELAIQR
ncbi:DUF1800 family protein [Luteolibacter luteus]|uniref:DUF1800 family protein n=1 Tax=Luteolibacter luteus TaxID=2728835 RepID=A0A858RPM4_9BACT|nr:DUF1800 family protein [Luteolibacter luteus]QJE98977.1 DUF1800 family protein [Luteolibacter luteus]